MLFRRLRHLEVLLSVYKGFFQDCDMSDDGCQGVARETDTLVKGHATAPRRRQNRDGMLDSEHAQWLLCGATKPTKGGA